MKFKIPALILMLSTAAMFSLSASAVDLKGSHKELKVKCKSCHIDGLKKPGKMEGCFNCHDSYSSIRELSEKNEELEANPHDSHLGDLDCNDCHMIHKPSEEAVCAECHNFDFVTP